MAWTDDQKLAHYEALMASVTNEERNAKSIMPKVTTRKESA
jgi:signal recognition particle GTPase